MYSRTALIAIGLLGILAGPVRAQDDGKKLAAQARLVFETNCYRCHGKDGATEGGFNYILDSNRLVERKRVVPKSVDKSKIWLRMASKDDSVVMPPPDEKIRPSQGDMEIVKQWIEGGAPEFPVVAVAKKKERKFLSETYVYKAMYDHLLHAETTDSARYQRFFTLAHLYNNPEVTDDNLRLYQAALAKMINSLSWRKNIILPKPVDPNGVVLAIDLRDLDWDLNYAWEKIVGWSNQKGGHTGYPYALRHDSIPQDAQLNVTAKQVYKLAYTYIPAVRADWFVATASVPPLYHELANIPNTAYELERLLKVDVGLNFRRDTLARAGFGLSGVSAQNRLVERHHATFGAYWKSFDFKNNDGDSNLLRYPLGPLNLFSTGKHPYANQAFVHAGGELIWALPNGLHAYMLINTTGHRINEGPADIVRDKNEFAGKGPVIVNGLSCMACHKEGMIDLPRDQIREGAGFQGAIREKIQRIYPEYKTMKILVDQDKEDYMRAYELVIAPYLRVGADEKKELNLFPEPVSLLASPYLRTGMQVESAAYELGFQDVKELTIAIKNNAALRDKLGLKIWTTPGGTLKRQVWESVGDTLPPAFSPFQAAAEELQRGQAYHFRRPNYDLP